MEMHFKLAERIRPFAVDKPFICGAGGREAEVQRVGMAGWQEDVPGCDAGGV